MKKKLLLLIALVCVAALSVCAFAACNNPDGGGDPEDGASVEGGETPDKDDETPDEDDGTEGETPAGIRENMPYDELVNMLATMTNYTLEYRYAYSEDGRVTESRYEFLKVNGDELYSEHSGNNANGIEGSSDRDYLFADGENDYWVRETNYHETDSAPYFELNAGGAFEIAAKERADKELNVWIKSESVNECSDATGFPDVIVPTFDVNNSNAAEAAVFVGMIIGEKDGIAVGSQENFLRFLGAESAEEISEKMFVEFTDGSVTVGYTYEDTDDNGAVVGEGYDKWTLTAVGETEVKIPDEIKAVKSECTQASRVDFNGVVYTKNTASYTAEINLYEGKANIITVEPAINGLPVGYVYVYPSVDVDAADFEVRLYFDRDGRYRGEYEYLGNASCGDMCGVNVRYYGEWREA